MTGSQISYFKKRAKALKAVVARGEDRAVARAEAVLHSGVADLSLMKTQHVIAVEAGFGSWAHLIAASATELQAAIARDKVPDLGKQIQAVLDQQPNLTVHGFRSPNRGSWRSEPHRTPEALREARAEFFSADESQRFERQWPPSIRSARHAFRLAAPPAHTVSSMTRNGGMPAGETKIPRIHTFPTAGSSWPP